MNELLCTVEEGVATLVLNRPRARNALSASLREALLDCIAALDADPEVRAIVLTGADPAFCAGVDLREIEANPQNLSHIGPRTTPLISASTPIIGAINGPAYTGGLELALSCHFLVASELASFADTHTALGLLPGWGLTVLLAEAVGSRRARQMSLSSRPIDANVALAWGLVNCVVAHSELLPAAQDIARAIAGNEPAAVRRVSQLLNEQAAARDATAWQLEAAAWTNRSVEELRLVATTRPTDLAEPGPWAPNREVPVGRPTRRDCDRHVCEDDRA